MATGENPDLALLSAYADGESMDEVLRSLTANGVITGRQQQTLDQAGRGAEATHHPGGRGPRRPQRRGGRQVRRGRQRRQGRRARQPGLHRCRPGQARWSTAPPAPGRRWSAPVPPTRPRCAGSRRARPRSSARSWRCPASRAAAYNGDTGGLLAKPGPGPVTSPYGWRIHPIYGYYGLHNGIDFGTGCGARLVAGESGTVVDKYFDEVYGNRLYLAIGKVNGASIVLVYNHMSGYAVGEGQHVKRGQVVGYSGSTGWSTGCHLHFIVMRNGEAVNPAPYL
ncbi:M23 family metallopeptidase [Nocardioides sp. W3-2-3]|uniref:M23 family metallopeptidase n=1 Tax=Nocardioides convexus TaxID=2712224 RepID=UPI002418481E|nr:M23 family metallopeptidase [Nocardioides convexus]NHA00305.1 M23 family metallopeptidase [Nocardioides convexus]